jgi:hypothetical protein
VNENMESAIKELGDEAKACVNDHPRPNGVECGYLSEKRFNQLTEKLIFVATAEGILPPDALAALAKALGTLSTFTARREGRPLEEVLVASQDTVACFAFAAEEYMKKSG